MNSYLLLIFGYGLIFFSIIFAAYRLQKTELTNEDYSDWRKFSKKLNFLKEKISRLVKISEKEVIFLFKNFREKILLRIKIEALKIETWANKKLENLKENSQNNV